MKRSKVSIDVPFSYTLHFVDDIFDQENPLMADIMAKTSRDRARFLVFVDEGVARAHPNLIEEIRQYREKYAGRISLAGPVTVLPGGEDAKNSFEVALKVIRFARQVHLCRHSFIIGVGGGAMLDAVGFAASMIHRGVRHIRVPTTVLAQNDSGVGVKNGINLRGAKNFLGTFAPPFAVLNDSRFLTTLQQRDWCAGIAEAYKVACIKDRDFLNWLLAHSKSLRDRDMAVMKQLIYKCATLHVQHIQEAGDPFETGSARPLDFGHWAAHKLESLTVHELRHGEAVAIGIAIDLLYAAQKGFVSKEGAMRVIDGLSETGLPVWDDTLKARDHNGDRLVYSGIEEFREHLGGKLHVTFPKPLGRKIEVSTLDRACLEHSLRELEKNQCSVYASR